MTRLLFVALLGLAAAASLLAPQWSRAQSLAGYYHDLVTRLRGPTTVQAAGSTVVLPADVFNTGLGTANAPTLLLSAGDDALVLATSGCRDSPAPLAACRLAAPLQPAGSAVAEYIVRIAPSARNVVVVGLTATADGVDAQPENNESFAVIAVVRRVALQARLLSRTTFPDGNQSVLVRIENTGPSDTQELRVDWQVSPGSLPVSAQCSVIGTGRCPGNAQLGRLDPGASLVYSFAFPPFTAQTPNMGLMLSATTSDASETGNGNTLSLSWSDPISSDGFE